MQSLLGLKKSIDEMLKKNYLYKTLLLLALVCSSAFFMNRTGKLFMRDKQFLYLANYTMTQSMIFSHLMISLVYSKVIQSKSLLILLRMNVFGTFWEFLDGQPS